MKRSEIFFHFPNYAWHMGNRLGGAVVTRNGMKLIRNYDDNSLELYDVVGDIAETKNRAKDKPQLAKRLNDKLSAWLKETKAPMPRPAKN